MDTIQYLAKHYFGDRGEASIRLAENLVNFPGVHLMTSPVADGIAAYIKISDFGLELLNNFSDENQLTKPLMMSLLQHPGDNILIFLLATSGYTTIRREFRNLARKENCSSISWFDPKTFKLQTHEVLNVARNK